jgi:hypothetical protein
LCCSAATTFFCSDNLLMNRANIADHARIMMIAVRSLSLCGHGFRTPALLYYDD